jgi:PleD family two-component response regulator
MESVPKVARKPVVAIAGQHEWLVRSLESIFTSNGYAAVARAGNETLEWLDATRPDLVVLEADPPDVLWQTMFDSVRRARSVTRATPILAATTESLSRQKRLEALRAGAWEVFGHPLDAEVLILKSNTFVAAKMEEEDARDRSLIDPETDFYNVRGVLRRIYEEASEAARNRRPLACVVASIDAPAAEVPSPERARALAQVFRRASRSSDVFGRLGPNEFVVVAPGTDLPGARRFAQRLADLAGRADVDEEGTARELPPLRAGFAAVSDSTVGELEPVDLFVRAVAALRAAQSAETGDRIRSFD